MKTIKSKLLNFKGIVSMVLALCMAIGGFIAVQADKTDAFGGGLTQYSTFLPIHEVSWADGSAGYGTSVETFTESGKTYYQDGSIIELAIKLPVNNKCVALQDIISYNPSELDLLSSYQEIGASQDAYYASNGWSAYVVGDVENTSTKALIHYVNDVMYAIPDEHTDPNVKIARLYFKVKAGMATKTGKQISIDFPHWEVADKEANFMTPGFDPADSAGTYCCACPSVSFTVKTKDVPETSPTLSLKGETVNIFEGDVFNPKDQISQVLDSQGGTMSKSDVTISGGDNKYTAHTPAAGSYTYTYSVTDNYGKTTTKNVTVNVTKRTYKVESVDTADKDINLDEGATEKEMQDAVEKVNDSTFKVTLSCNDGNKLVVDAVSTGGVTDKYEVDDKGVLTSPQEFGVDYTLALPIISYDSEGNRTITKYNGSNIEDWNKQSATGSTYDVATKVTVKGGGSGNNDGDDDNGGKDDNGGNTGGTSNGSNAGTSGGMTSNGSNGGSSTSGIKTGDETSVANYIYVSVAALLSLAFLAIKKFHEVK